jgi:hypothetical protein
MRLVYTTWQVLGLFLWGMGFGGMSILAIQQEHDWRWLCLLFIGVGVVLWTFCDGKERWALLRRGDEEFLHEGYPRHRHRFRSDQDVRPNAPPPKAM